MNSAKPNDEVMAGMRRLLMVLALLAPPGCIVGPQEDLPIDPQKDPSDSRNEGGDAGAGADGDADADLGGDDMPPEAAAEYPDDGDFAADGAGEFDEADPSIEDVDGATVPGVPIPRPGMPSPRPDVPDLDAAGTFPPGAADLGTVDGPTDDDV